MNTPSGLFTAIPKNAKTIPSSVIEQCSASFGRAIQQVGTAMVYNQGGLWQAYEQQDYHFYIDGDIFYRNEKLTEGINANERFVQNFSIDQLKKIKGNFNAVIIGKHKAEAYILTGAHGLKPLFVHHQGEMIYVGDDLRLFKRALPELQFSEFALVQLLLFNFPLGKQSFLEKVELIPGGWRLDQANDFQGECWYDIEASILGPALTAKQSLTQLRESLNSVVDQYLAPETKPGLSLTGGFDGRTILSAIRQREHLQLYTFGSRSSTDIKVAKQISEQLDLPHHAFYIDQDYYENHFKEEAREFIVRSNGIGTYERTHYLHAFKNMAGKVDFLLTGNAGSEVFRTILEGGIHIPQLAFDLLSASDPIETIRQAIATNKVLQSLRVDANHYTKALYQIWCELMGEYKNEATTYRGAYRFFMKESLRKWFGTEMRIENKYCPNRTPFLDEEFLEVLHQSPFSVAYQPFRSNNPIQRKVGQTTYAHILVKNDPELASIDTNRGYSPYDVTTLLGIPRIAYSFFTKKIRNKHENDYNQFETAHFFFDHFLPELSSHIPWLDRSSLNNLYTDGASWKAEIRDFSRVVCLGLWYASLESSTIQTEQKVGKTAYDPL